LEQQLESQFLVLQVLVLFTIIRYFKTSSHNENRIQQSATHQHIILGC